MIISVNMSELKSFNHNRWYKTSICFEKVKIINVAKYTWWYVSDHTKKMLSFFIFIVFWNWRVKVKAY